jgi:pimeloyl-ACP methyl ester carboxylesterase
MNLSVTHTDQIPTVVLVHGASADASSWAGVISELQGDGAPVLAFANPLRGLHSDAAYIAARVKQIAGPVLLVGHSASTISMRAFPPRDSARSSCRTPSR